MNDTTNVTTELRAMVRRELPEVSEIQDSDLREKVIEVWALAISESSFNAISEIKASGNPDTPQVLPRSLPGSPGRGFFATASTYADPTRTPNQT